MPHGSVALVIERQKARIDIGIRRLSLGNPGNVRPIGKDVSKLRIHHGPGYRIYITSHGNTTVVLLAGGDNSSQNKEIQQAKSLAQNL